ncbi:hypothetical protein [Butyrivibrio sp. WCD2001]|uniref:hypothetical protein n=1 Tax=Butyrivibrio sp. WCD2001 TaxID=1280681 RepID=UPI0003FD0267|nr:hypothetical protein [Butyrivibrio sp. WCD2001]
MKERGNTINIRIIGGALLSLIIPLAIVLIAVRAWETNFCLEDSFGGDGMLCQLLIKSIANNGIRGLWIDNYLGAPELSSLVDTPFLDLPMGMEIFMLTRVIKSTRAVLWAMYIISYPCIGVFMYVLVTRKLTDYQVLNAAIAIAYSIAPYHFIRAMGHSTLSRYYSVPICVFISMLIIEEEYRKGSPVRYGKFKTICMYLLCLLLGLSNIYYAFFGLVCIFSAVLIKILRTKSVRVLWNEALAVYFTLLGVFIGLFPHIYYTIKYGENSVAGVRYPQETEMFALKIIQLVLPCGYNRIPFLRNMNTAYSTAAFNINENGMASLGLLATIGFICACGIIVSKFAFDNNERTDRPSRRLTLFSFLILVLIVYSMGGGIGTIVAYLITPEIRALNRCSIVISCLSLCVLNILVGKLYDFSKRNKTLLAFYSIVLMAVGLTLYSEVRISDKGWQEPLKERNEICHRFFDDVQNSLEKGTLIYQLPHTDFPESLPSGTMTFYEPALAYVMTDGFMWSYGGIMGRDTKAHDLYIDDGISDDFVNGIKEAGFTAVYIDTKGYDDGGEEIISFYSDELGLSPIISDDASLYLYVLN